VSERALELARRGRTAYLDVGIAALRRAADLYPNAYLAQQNLTTRLLAMGMADGALEGALRMEALAQGAETRATARYLLGAALSSLGRMGEARTALEGALAEGPLKALAEAITALLDGLP
jgi:tetratricopeptide (TPR) repeat protein